MIRQATHSDIPAMLAMGRDFHVESNWGQWADFDADSFETTLTTFIEQPNWRVLVYDSDGPKGFICGVLTPLYFNHNVSVAQELLWWVHPDHRGGVGSQLLEAFHQGADFGLQTVGATVPRSEVVKAALERKGWQPVEHNFIKDLR